MFQVEETIKTRAQRENRILVLGGTKEAWVKLGSRRSLKQEVGWEGRGLRKARGT